MNLPGASQLLAFSVVSFLFLTGSVVLVRQMAAVGQGRCQVKYLAVVVVVTLMSPM